MTPVTVLTFNEASHAEPLRRRLEEAGIPAEIHDDAAVEKYVYLSPPLARIRVRVDRADFERARVLLKEWDRSEGALRHAIHCPECGSSRVQFPQLTRKVFISWIGAVLCAVGLIERKFYCQDCHLTWPVKAKASKERDLLGWPKKARSEGQ